MSQSESLILKKASINGIDIVPEHIIKVEIFESITQPGITGYIDLMDYQGIAELGEVFAGDVFELSFSINESDKNPLINQFTIYSNEGSRVLPHQTYNVTRFGFCSPWLLDGLTLKYSKNYKDKYIHEIVKDLLTFAGASIGYIEPTKQKLDNFVSPLWTPYHTIKHLLSFALNNNNNAGYLCWTDLSSGKVNVTTLDYLMKGTLGTYKKFNVYPGNMQFEGRVKDLTFETSYDLIRLLNNGMPITKYQGFNFDTGQIVSTSDSITDLHTARLGKKLPIPKAFKNYATVKYSSLFPNSNTVNKVADVKDLINGKLANEYMFLSSDIFKINIDSNGEMQRRVGWLAELDFPSQNINAGDNTGNKLYKGNYLIRDIKHTFSLYLDYSQTITLVGDGYKEFSRDSIKW